ncbi:MAG: VanZ family protein [Halobacteriales archaeon]|nr:VanZ family protein [Halobacteriales archaeon]
MRPRRRWLAVGVVAAVILVASLLPTSGGPTPTLLGVGLDKWQHLGGYAVLAGTLGYALVATEHAGRRVALGLAVTVGYGILIECLQAPLSTRVFSVADMLANAVGALVGTALVSRFGR